MLRHLRIYQKLILLVSVLFLTIAAISWMGLRTITRADLALKTMYEDRVVALEQLMDVSGAYSDDVLDTVRKLRAKQITSKEARAKIEDVQADIEKQWKGYASSYRIDEEKELVANSLPVLQNADKTLIDLLGIIERQKPEEIDKFIDKTYNQVFAPITDIMEKLSRIQVRAAKDIFQNQETESARAHIIIYTVIGLGSLLSLFLSYYIINMITTPLKYATDIIRRMSEGDLDFEITNSDARDESGEIIRSTAAIAATLTAVSHDLSTQINAAKEGSLSVRSDSSAHPGAFKDIIDGINALLDTLTEPMTEIAAVMARLASGDIRGRIMGDYQGELRALKGNVNRSLEALVQLLDEVAEFSRTMSSGDLTSSINGVFQGEFANIKQNLNTAAEQLRSVLTSVVDTTENVSISAVQTTAAASEVARHAGSQMVTLTEVSDAIEQTVIAVSEIASASERGSELARQATGAAEAGQSDLVSLTGSVHTIASKNQHISQISELIENIADKTYVLSLNAGLEALRAGDHGAGFGLIATKITALAEEVAGATRSIKQLTNEATEAVQEGVDISNRAQLSMRSIVEMSQQNGLNVQSIAASIEEQSSMMAMLRVRVDELKLVGNTTASAAEEISMTMKALEGMTQSLKASTDQIKTK